MHMRKSSPTVSPCSIVLHSKKVGEHEKRGHYVSSHLHLNVTYLLETDSRSVLASNLEENSTVGWFPLDKAFSMSNEH